MVGKGTSESRRGPKVMRPRRAIDDVAALSRRTGGGLEELTNAACKTGELELNRTVMNAIVARPRWYSASLEIIVALVVDVDDVNDGDRPLSSMMPPGRNDGLVISSVLLATASLHCDGLLLALRLLPTREVITVFAIVGTVVKA